MTISSSCQCCKETAASQDRCGFCEKYVCISEVVSVVKDRQHLRIDVVSVRNLCAMIVFFFSNEQ